MYRPKNLEDSEEGKDTELVEVVSINDSELRNYTIPFNKDEWRDLLDLSGARDPFRYAKVNVYLANIVCFPFLLVGFLTGDISKKDYLEMHEESRDYLKKESFLKKCQATGYCFDSSKDSEEFYEYSTFYRGKMYRLQTREPLSTEIEEDMDRGEHLSLAPGLWG